MSKGVPTAPWLLTNHVLEACASAVGTPLLMPYADALVGARVLGALRHLGAPSEAGGGVEGWFS